MKKILITLFALLTVIPVLEARNVNGKVSCNDKGVKGVIVTDGVNFVKTRANGQYKLSIDNEADFVYIVTPAGYIPDCTSGTPAFYQKIRNGQGQYDFVLGRIANPRSSDYTIFSISDPQMKTREHIRQFEQKPFRDLVKEGKSYMRKGQLVGIALGDIGWDSIDLTYPIYKDIMKGIGFPVYPVIGNHDHNLRKQGIKSREDYEDEFGPSNYAFWLGKDLVICVDDIIYDTNKKYQEGYSEDVLAFVESLLKLIPQGTHLFLAQHSPVYRWWVKEPYIVNADRMLGILHGYKVDILSGHTHVQCNTQINEDVYEHNAPSICGAWWMTEWCRDGVPWGYEIFTNKKGELKWFYHSIGYKDDYQVEIIKKGESENFPDSIIANVWDYDEQWSVDWYQDGELMGPMERVRDCSPTYRKQRQAWQKKNGEKTLGRPFNNNHYFKADPKEGSKVTIVVKSRFGKEWKYDVQ